MQPLISVEHESRHNSNHAETDHSGPEEAVNTENTPLLQRFPPYLRERNPTTTVIVTFLVIIFIAGAIIGIYLLVLQSRAEHVLPPVEIPFQLVSRSQWDRSNVSRVAQKMSPHREKLVIVLQTGTGECFSTDSCTALLQAMQDNSRTTNGVLPYNFLISSNGQTYEALGWTTQSQLNYTQYSASALVLAFIGDFAKVSPSRLQMEEAKNFFAESVSLQYLDPAYSIIGKTRNNTPHYLFESLKQFPQWNSKLSDA